MNLKDYNFMPTLTHTALSATKANKKENSASKTRAASQSSTLSDHRPGTLAQMKVVEAMSEGPRAQKTAQLQALMPDNSPVQKATDEEEVQMKAKPIQKAADEEEVQMKAAPVQKKENNTGLPDNLKSGVENLSGVSLDDVKVHTNSDQPAQMQAHAFAQGTDIHVAPGQEQHLPHEAWHVVQQKQGRVKPTTQMKEKIPVNDDKGLEDEADVMGAKALSVGNSDQGATQLKELNVNSSAIHQFADAQWATEEDIKRVGSEVPKEVEEEKTAEAATKNRDSDKIGIGDVGEAIGNTAGVVGGAIDENIFNADGPATGDVAAGELSGDVGGVAAAGGKVLGSVVSGYKAYEKGWKNLDTTDPLSMGDAAIAGTQFISKATETAMKFAKSDSVAGMFPGVNSGLNLLQAGLNMMKDKRASDAIKKIEKGGTLNTESTRFLEQYASNVQWKMIEDGAEALWATAELVGLAFPGANVGMSFLHSSVNLLKGGVKMYQKYSSGKKAKAAERIDVGKGGGLDQAEVNQLQSTKTLIDKAGGASTEFFLTLIQRRKLIMNTQQIDNPTDKDKKDLAQLQEDEKADLLKLNEGMEKPFKEEDIFNAMTTFLNLINSLKDDVLQDQGRFKRFSSWVSGGYFGQKVNAHDFFAKIFGDDPEKKVDDLQILKVLQKEPDTVGKYLGPKLERTIESAQDYSAKDLSNDQLVSNLIPTLVSSASSDKAVFKTFEGLNSDIFKESAMWPGKDLATAEFKAGLEKYFKQINPF